MAKKNQTKKSPAKSKKKAQKPEFIMTAKTERPAVRRAAAPKPPAPTEQKSTAPAMLDPTDSAFGAEDWIDEDNDPAELDGMPKKGPPLSARTKIAPERAYAPALVDRHVQSALKALNAGTASPAQQQLALSWVVHYGARTYDVSWHPTDRETSFAEGRRFVGIQITRVINAAMMEMTNG